MSYTVDRQWISRKTPKWREDLSLGEGSFDLAGESLGFADDVAGLAIGIVLFIVLGVLLIIFLPALVFILELLILFIPVLLLSAFAKCCGFRPWVLHVKEKDEKWLSYGFLNTQKAINELKANGETTLAVRYQEM